MKHSPFFYWVVGIAITAIIVVTAFCLDDEVRDFIAQHQNRTVENIARWVSLIGNWPGHYYPGLVLAGVCWWRGRKKWMRVFLAMVLALVIAGMISRGINITAGRARPSVGPQEVWHGMNFRSKYHAFPSGHVAASAAFFAVLFLANRRVGAAFLAIPILIGLSRLYLEAHYLSDVVCAAVLGTLAALLMARLLVWSTRHPKATIPDVELSLRRG